MTYEELKYENPNINIVEMDLSEVQNLKGLCVNDNIAIRRDIPTTGIFLRIHKISRDVTSAAEPP